MKLPLYQVDAFTSRLFGGNPAAVVLLEDWLPDDVLAAIAAENNLAETAFVIPGADTMPLRWFTPKVEVPLCGHATLASAAVVMERLEPGRREVVFQSASGPLSVTRTGASYAMNFPSRPSVRVPTPEALTRALGADPLEVWENSFNFMAVFERADAVRALVPDMPAVASLGRPGVIATAAGDRGFDCVSRYFAPAKGIPEDPVTGGAHCMLAPYWAQRLGKSTLRAHQASARGGELTCRVVGERVELEGACVFYLEGEAEY